MRMLFFLRSSNTLLLNKINERSLRLIFIDDVSSFQDILTMNNEKMFH